MASLSDRPSLLEQDDIVAVAVSGDEIATLSPSHQVIQVWRASTGTPSGDPLKVGQRNTRVLALSDNGKRVAFAGQGGTLHVWNTSSGVPIPDNPIIGDDNAVHRRARRRDRRVQG